MLTGKRSLFGIFIVDELFINNGVIQDLHIVDLLWCILLVNQDDETVFACEADCRPKVSKVGNSLFTNRILKLSDRY